ncbi:MAG TPA: PQQ-binding-like beta-propeller repeat protein, partial [Isosphaeraceae bacterium]|nr:PQQ-binding-like beta-propeller repeat protein [Isosphaeraceae bacterium]
VQCTTYVACLDAETGAPLWVRFVFQGNSGFDNGMGAMFTADLNHRLLSLEGSTVYYQTNLGAVAALDAETGRVRWLATYPRQERGGGAAARGRDLNPAVVHNGLAIVAPEDNPRIFAFDAATGRLVWKSKPLKDVAHLLGVAHGRLIATGDHVYSLDVRDGRIVRSWPEGGNEAGLEGYGRGVLAGDYIYWPTKTEIHVLDQATGLRADRPPIKLQEMFQTSGGNLAVGDGYLIVAQPDALVVFCQNSRLIERYREEIARAPEQASTYFRLAQAAEATKQEQLALDNLAEAIQKARPAEVVDGAPLVDTARDHLYRLLMKLASKSAAAREWDQADTRYEEAANAARLDRDRLAARFRLAEVQGQRGEAARAVATLQSVLVDERLRQLNVPADEHRTVRADLLITDRLEALLRQSGRALYGEFDKEADRLLERGRAEKDPRVLEEVGRSYPVAQAVPASLAALGELCEALKRPAESAQAYKRLLAVASTDADRARALVGLAEAYEAQGLWVSAREAYAQVLNRFPDQRVGADGPEGLAGAIVARRLEREPFRRIAADRPDPNLPFPLERRWDKRFESKLRPIAAEGVPPSASAGRVFLAERTELKPVDPCTGQSAWNTDLGDEPIWVGYLADRVLAATASKLAALDLEKGTIVWQSDLDSPRPGQPAGLNPFTRPDSGAPRRETSPGRLHDFRIVGSRVFCQRGDRELVAFDGDRGLVDWSFAPSSGKLNPHLWIGPQRIVLQVMKPTAILVLNTQNGRTQAEYAREDDQEWSHDPLPVSDDQVALVVDRRSIGLFDFKRGVFPWVVRESPLLPRHGPPLLLGDAERLLVLYDGSELIRLDPRTGGKLWSRPLGDEDLSERPEAFVLD